MQEGYDGLKVSHGSISLSKVNAFNLRETLSNQSSLIPQDNPMLILLVLEYPLYANHIATLSWLLH
jgi:hypothetical protein